MNDSDCDRSQRSTTINVDAELAALGPMRDRLEALVADYLGREQLQMLLVAVTEGVTNAIEAQHRNGCHDPIIVDVDPDRRVITITDRGGGLGEERRRLDASPPPPAARRGRGLVIMRSISPDLRIVDTDHGTRVELPY